MYESGRAGRDNQCSWDDTLYYNNGDIAIDTPGMTDEMRIYCKTTRICLSKHNNLKLSNSSCNFKCKLRAKLFAAFLSPRS